MSAMDLPDRTIPEKKLRRDADDKRATFREWVRRKETNFTEIKANTAKCVDSELEEESDPLLTILGFKERACTKTNPARIFCYYVLQMYTYLVVKVTGEARVRSGKSYLVSLDSDEGTIDIGLLACCVRLITVYGLCRGTLPCCSLLRVDGIVFGDLTRTGLERLNNTLISSRIKS